MCTLSLLYGFLKEWQTLIGSILALCAAFLTIRVMRGQIRLDENRHKDLSARRKMAARAQMPDALSDIVTYARNCCVHFLEDGDQPIQPVAALNSLKGVIEFIDDEESERTFKLVSWFQVQNARMKDRSKYKEANLDDSLYDVVLLVAYANSLFDYARNQIGDAESGEPSKNDMHAALRNAISTEIWASNDERLSGLYAHIERRHN